MTEQATVSIGEALDATRTGDIWVFRGRSGPDRLIQTLSNSPVNHVGMTLAIDDLPPLMWHAELGSKLTDVWTGGNHRGVQLHDAREAIERWSQVYGQRCWLRQLSPRVTREQEDAALRVVARMDGTPFPATARLTGLWAKGRIPSVSDWTRGIPFVHKKVREAAERDKMAHRQTGLETAFCAETVAITYEEMGLLITEKRSEYFDPGSFWSGDILPMAPGYALGREIVVEVPEH
ncbi:MAG: guanylate cyclase [Mycobacterium sp.]